LPLPCRRSRPRVRPTTSSRHAWPARLPRCVPVELQPAAFDCEYLKPTDGSVAQCLHDQRLQLSVCRLSGHQHVRVSLVKMRSYLRLTRVSGASTTAPTTLAPPPTRASRLSSAPTPHYTSPSPPSRRPAPQQPRRPLLPLRPSRPPLRVTRCRQRQAPPANCLSIPVVLYLPSQASSLLCCKGDLE
jgi:hypothetical protein